MNNNTGNRTKIKAVIFDMDGTLIDSEPNYAIADCELVSRYGGNMTAEEHKQFVGIGTIPFLKYIKEQFNIPVDIDKLKQELTSIYLDIALKSTPVFENTAAFLKKVKMSGMKTAIASGSTTEIIHLLMDRTGLSSWFDCFVSVDEVDKGKPAPDIFIKAAEKLNIKPYECAVVEDSLAGMKAAKAAGMFLIAVPGFHLDKKNREDFDFADLFFPGIDSFCSDRAFSVLTK